MSEALRVALDGYVRRIAPAVQEAVAAAATTVPVVRARFDAAGVDPHRVDAGQLARLPVLSKDDVQAQQAGRPPFGGLLAPGAEVRRVFQSPGPLYEPQLAGADPWRWAPALTAAGIGPGDLVLNCFGYHLSPAGAMFDEAASALGAGVLPGGIGSQDLQARAIADLAVTAYTGLPSYLHALLDRFDAAGLDARAWRLRKAVVTAEPLPDSLRAALQQRVPTVLIAYGTAETGLIGYETSPGNGLVPGEGVLVQVCDLDSGRPLVLGEGQVVVTLLRPGYPLIRFGTGDLSSWRLGPEGDLRLTGVLGRVGQAVKVRGMFLHPRQAHAVLDDVDGVSRWRFRIDRVNHRDDLTCELVVDPRFETGAVVGEVQARIRSGLRFACAVTPVPDLPADAAAVEDHRDWQ